MVQISTVPEHGARIVSPVDGRANELFQLYLDDIAQRLNDFLLGAQVQLPSYAVATLPTAANAGGLIYVNDESGGAVPAFSDGTNWRRVTDRAIVS